MGTKIVVVVVILFYIDRLYVPFCSMIYFAIEMKIPFPH